MKKLILILLSVLLISDSLLSVAEDRACTVRQVKGVVYKTAEGQEIKLNLFLPERDGQPLKKVPLLIWLDSGCWYSNGPGNGGIWCAIKAVERGAAVASVGHRTLSPDCCFPKQIEDVRAAVRFLRANAEEYGLDSERFAAMGCSSGGHLACMLGITCRDFDIGDNLDQSGQVQRVIDFFGPSDLSIFVAHHPSLHQNCLGQALGITAPAPGENFLQKYNLYILAAKRFSPMTYVDSKFAPTLIFHGGADPVVPPHQSFLLHDVLKYYGVKTKLIYREEAVHSVESFKEPEKHAQEILDFLDWGL